MRRDEPRSGGAAAGAATAASAASPRPSARDMGRYGEIASPRPSARASHRVFTHSSTCAAVHGTIARLQSRSRDETISPPTSCSHHTACSQLDFAAATLGIQLRTTWLARYWHTDGYGRNRFTPALAGVNTKDSLYLLSCSAYTYLPVKCKQRILNSVLLEKTRRQPRERRPWPVGGLDSSGRWPVSQRRGGLKP